jgi:hypothetical protein
LVWDYPSIAAIVDYLIEQLGSQGAATNNGDGAVRPGALTVPAGAMPPVAVDDMSDQEVTALLNQLIADERAGASL